jgi:hypothetical protein
MSILACFFAVFLILSEESKLVAAAANACTEPQLLPTYAGSTRIYVFEEIYPWPSLPQAHFMLWQKHQVVSHSIIV